LHEACEITAQARVPESIRSVSGLSSLTATKKDNNRIRGISAGHCLRRLVARTISKQKQDRLRAAIAPFNFGLADRSGIDSLIHLIRLLTDSDRDLVVTSIDGVGAFDHVARARFFDELYNDPELADLIPFVRMWYGQQSVSKWFDENGRAFDIYIYIYIYIYLGGGGEQGDALMPALFCLALKPALLEMNAHLPGGCFAVAYFDDIYVITDPEHARPAYDIMKEVLHRTCHIDVNIGKLAAWSKRKQAAPPGIAELGPEVWKYELPDAQCGLKIVGTPFGSAAFIEDFTTVLIEKETKLVTLLPLFSSLQCAWTILYLYYCAIPRMTTSYVLCRRN